jgi:hypothetical protein
VLEQVLSTASQILEQGIGASLSEAEQMLFKQAEQARQGEHQNRCFEALREIRRGRSDVAPRFVIRLEAALAGIDKAHASPQFSRVNREKPSELVLVDEAEFEESLALLEVASKCEIRNSAILFALGQRFGVLAGSKAFEPEELPVGPHRICECLRDAVGCLDLALDFRIVLYRAFDRACGPLLTQLFEAINQTCIDQRILPNLAISVPRTKAAGSSAATPAARPPDAPEPNPPAAPGPPAPPASTPPPPVMPARPAPPVQSAPIGAPSARGSGFAATASLAMPDLSDIPGAVGLSNPMTGWPGAPAAGMPKGADAGAPDPRDVEMFETMRDLMAGRRHALGGGKRLPPSQAHDVKTADVQAVLGALQAKPATPVRAGGKVVSRSIAHVKQDMLDQLRQLAPENKTPQLEDVDNDTIDLVGMLFDHLSRNAKPTGAVSDFLTRLQVPLLRVALKDKSFFTRRAHPARQLLNSIAEAGLFWLDDDAEDRQLVDKMKLVVDRVTSEYDGDLNVFDELLTDLSKHLGTLARKSEVAERRHVDAAKGRERLELARAAAADAIAQKIAGRKPPPLIRTLLEQAWADVLALTILRQGENSDNYRRRLDVADRLLRALDGGARPDEATAQALREEIETGLAQVGYHGEDIGALVGRLFGGPTTPEADESPTSLTELAIKIKSRARLGADTDTAGDTDGPRTGVGKGRDKVPLSAEEQRVLDRLRTVPFGTWFEFKTNQQGDTVRRRLSWFSTMTGRCLFVNQRGVRSDEMSLEQLAREIVRGQASAVEAQKETLIDRAWTAIVDTLKGFAGSLVSPTPSAATP